jgi:chromosome segregation ATPase
MPDDTTVSPELQKLEEVKQEIEAKQAELDRVKGETSDYENKKSALNKELERIIAKIEDARQQKRQADVAFQAQFKREQEEKAKAQFFEKFSYDDAARKSILDDFARSGSTAIDADNIYQELVRLHVARNASKYLSLEEKAKEFAGSAEKFLETSSSAGFASGGSPPTGQTELTAEDIEAAKFSGMSLEVYRDLKSRGKI